MKFLLTNLFFAAICMFVACNDTDDTTPDLTLTSLQAGNRTLLDGPISGVSLNTPIILAFDQPVDTTSLSEALSLLDDEGNPISLRRNFSNENKNITVYPTAALKTFTEYTIKISDLLTTANGKGGFPGVEVTFITVPGTLSLKAISAGLVDLTSRNDRINVPLDLQLKATFSDPLDDETINSKSVYLKRKGIKVDITTTLDGNELTVTANENLSYYSTYELTLDTTIRAIGADGFEGFQTTFFTALDSTVKFQEVTDDELLTMVQEQTFKYFYDMAGPNSGLARERNSSGNTVTSGGSGFGIMALIVGIERGFISRSQGLDRIEKIVTFLEKADRFHGVYPHWIDDTSGKVIPFSTKDNGGDLVETSFLFQGLLTFRQYLDSTDPRESQIIYRINALWEGVEWDWYTNGGQNVLYWHWSPNYGWEMNFALRGYYEAMITYVLAASSPTHTIGKDPYQLGWMRNGGVLNGKSFYDIKLPIGYDYGGPLFFAHYSFLGLDPRNLQDKYANYWEQNVAHSQINYQHCVLNPRNHLGYNGLAWGLTASDEPDGYGVHEPTRDNGTISPTAALSSFPYTPTESMAALRYFYYILGDRLWGNYGFYDAYNVEDEWWTKSTLAIDQGPVIVMIENHRTGLLWNLFMSAPEIQTGLEKLEIFTN